MKSATDVAAKKMSRFVTLFAPKRLQPLCPSIAPSASTGGMTGNKLHPSDRADVGSHGNLRSVQQLRKYRQVRGHMTGSAVVINLSDRSGH